MKLTFKRREIKDLQQLGTLVTENVDGIEPGLKIIGSNLNLGRASIELVALDSSHTPVLVTLGLTADDTMLLRALEAYAWCLDYPESLQKLVPASSRPEWPPRVVFVAERLLESFVRKMRLLKFSTVDFFEFRYVEANGTMGFYLDRADWDRNGAASPDDEREENERRERLERPVHRPAAPSRPVEPVAEQEESEESEETEEQVEPEEEREVVVHGEPVAVEEPKIVMLHEPKPAPRLVEPRPRLEPPPRAEPAPRLEPLVEPAPRPAPRVEPPRRVEPLPRVEAPRRLEPPPPPPRVDPPKVAAPPPRVVSPAASNGGREPADDKVVLKGLRVPAEAPRGRRLRDLPHVPVKEAPATPPRESDAPAASTRPARVETSTPSTIDPRIPRKGAPARNGSRNDTPKTDPPKIDAPRPEAPKGDLAPTWRKFLDRLTGTFDARPATPAPAPRASAAPAPTAPEPLAVQPFAADLHLQPEEVAPDEVIDESQDQMTELSEQQRSALKGLTLPDNGELAPQWRKFLDHPTLDEAKIAVVRGYLQREFPLCTVYDFYDFQRNAQVFQLQDNHGQVTQLITLTAEFFDSHRDLEIRAWIEKHKVAHAMRQAGQSGVLVSQAGLQIEKS
jgi:hypothetical protein